MCLGLDLSLSLNGGLQGSLTHVVLSAAAPSRLPGSPHSARTHGPESSRSLRAQSARVFPDAMLLSGLINVPSMWVPVLGVWHSQDGADRKPCQAG